MRSAALPVPSHMTTGIGGLLVMYCITIRTVLGPPSIITPTRGTPDDPSNNNYSFTVNVKSIQMLNTTFLFQ